MSVWWAVVKSSGGSKRFRRRGGNVHAACTNKLKALPLGAGSVHSRHLSSGVTCRRWGVHPVLIRRLCDSKRTYARGSSDDALSVESCMILLGIDELDDRVALRSAYYERMKELHPDVNPDFDTTRRAAAVNAAYTLLTQELEIGGKRGANRVTDTFGRCTSAPDQIFVNPFACGVDPFMWRELQSVARNSPEDPEEALMQSRVATLPGTISYLTTEQLQAAEALLEEMEQSFSFETSSWLLADAMLRASRANGFRSR